MPKYPGVAATLLAAFVLLGCTPSTRAATPPPGPGAVPSSATAPPVPSSAPQASPPAAAVSATSEPALVPQFENIVIVVFENKEFGSVVDSPQMPYFNELANAHTLLTQFFAVAHPSLPNYLAMISGDTFGLTFDCTKCLYDAPSLPDLVEQSGRTWRAYQEDMPAACFDGPEAGNYAMKHNPFVYFKRIRLDAGRCARSVVPMNQLYADLAAGNLPNYAFITPNLCNDAHDCGLAIADNWLRTLMLALQPALEAPGKPYLIVITWDEGQGDHSCCGLPAEAGGRIATILVSPQAKSDFEDATPYTHYSLLKTIEESWQLRYLGHSADPENVLITVPWK